jgi:hypothetical protein
MAHPSAASETNDPSRQPERRERRAPEGPATTGPAPDGSAPFMGTVVDRRLGLDRRVVGEDAAKAGSETPELERRRGAGRRRSDFLKSADEGELTKEQFLFLMSIQAFKKSNQTMFPTWTDVLEVIRLLGYRKTMASELRLTNAEDWREAPDAPANVRTIDGKRVRHAA